MTQASKDKLHEIRSQILKLHKKLEEFHQYKRIMLEEGLEADISDKERESKLIIQVTRAEKKLAALEGRKYQAPKRGAKRANLVTSLEEQNKKEQFFAQKARNRRNSGFRKKV